MTKAYNQFIRTHDCDDGTLFPRDIRKLTHSQVEEIKVSIECELSPESISCDGEATNSEINATLHYYLILCREISLNTEFICDFSELNS